MHELPKHIILPVGGVGRVNKVPLGDALTNMSNTVPDKAMIDGVPVNIITFGGWVTHIDPEHHKVKYHKGDGILEGSRRPFGSKE